MKTNYNFIKSIIFILIGILYSNLIFSQDLADCNINVAELVVEQNGISASLQKTINFTNDCGCNGIGNCEIVRIDFPENFDCFGTVVALDNSILWFDDYFDIYDLPSCDYNGQDDIVFGQKSNYIAPVSTQVGGSYDILICAGEDLPSGQNSVTLDIFTSDLCFIVDCSLDNTPPVCGDANIVVTADPSIGFAEITFTDYVTDNCSINFSDGNDITNGEGVFNNEILVCNTTTEFEVAFFDDAGNQILCNYQISVECSDCENVAIDFDGVDDYIEFNSPLVGNQNYTIEMWVKSESVSTGECRNNDSSSLDWILAFDDNDLGIVDCDGGYRVVFAPLCPSGNNLCSSLDDRPLDDGQWHHLAISEGDPGGFRVYYDGEKFTNFSFDNYDLGGIIRLGSQFGNQGGNKFKGTIDEVRIWDHIRTEEEVMEHYNCKIDPTTAGLITYYDFSDGIPNGDNSGLIQINDNSANGNNATLFNFNGVGSSSNFVSGIDELCNSCGGNSVECSSNQAIDFDGVDDIISLDNVEISSDFTVGCWFKTSQDNGGSEDRFFGFGNSPRLEVGVDFDGSLWFFDELGGLSTFLNVRDNLWHHVAVVGTGSTRKIYFDFQMLGEFDSQPPNYGPNLKLGSWSPNNLSGTAFWGQLDDFRFYSEAFDSNDICAEFSSTPLVGLGTLQVYMDFEQGSALGNNSSISTAVNLGVGPNGVFNSFSMNGETSNFICADYDAACLTSVNDIYNVISIYPNPSKDILFLESLNNEVNIYNIITLTGKVVSSGKLSEDLTTEVDISVLEPGVYFVKTYNMEGAQGTLKFVKN